MINSYLEGRSMVIVERLAWSQLIVTAASEDLRPSFGLRHGTQTYMQVKHLHASKLTLKGRNFK